MPNEEPNFLPMHQMLMLAQTLATYRNSLIAAGFSSEEAFTLVVELQYGIVGNRPEGATP